MEKPFVLIIEDERDIAALFRHVLDLAGYRTEVCSNGKLALELLAECQPNVVLLDLSLPGIPGADVLQRMRLDDRLKHIPVVVVTAYSEMADSMAVEPDLVMLKPVSAVQLADLVQRLAHRSQHPDAAPFAITPWDELTGLYNRSFFRHRLDSAIANLRNGGPGFFAVLAVSPDRYELLNHEFGARRANDFLRSLGVALRACVRPTDTIARFDADRFFILIEQAPGPHIPELIAARIQQRLRDQSFGEPPERVTCYMSVLLCDRRYGRVEQALQDATSAYDLARAAGPGSCLTFDHASIRTGLPHA